MSTPCFLQRISVGLLGFAGVTLGLIAADGNSSTNAKTLSVAAVQMRSSTNLSENVIRISRSLRECAAQNVRVAVFPECALTGYFESAITNSSPADLENAEQQLAELCKELSMYAIVGTPYWDGPKPYNSALVITPVGKIVERYHKVQLAEGWPTPGDHLSVFRIDGVPCSIIICHDERYPELVRLPVLAGAKIIFYVSHESGLREEHKLNPYRAQIQARAVENTVFIVHANAPANADGNGSHGQSRIIAPDGNIVQEASFFREETVIAKLELSKATQANARRSLTGGPLQDWWREGVKRVRMIE